jgi:hypothetical protein
MGEKLSRVSSVTAALAVLLVTALLSVGVVEPASSTTRRAAPPTATFTVSSFNVLGASHTPAGSSRAPGTTRIVWAKQLLDQHHVQVAGFQEMQAVQYTKFAQLAGSSWALYPGLTMLKRDSENSIGWRTDTFDLVWASTVKIPYFNGSLRSMPVVLLREKSTGMLAYFANVHNPADTATYHNQGVYRAEATRMEIALQNLIAPTGIPRFLTGDMNERASYFCRVTKEAPLKAARPRSTWVNGVCSAGSPRAVDWILGSTEVPWSNYIEDRSALVAKTTDHPMIIGDATIDTATFPNALTATPPAPIVPGTTF